MDNLHYGRNGSVPPKLNRSTILSETACRSLPHVAICVLGNFKGKDGINYHTVNVASKSQTGFPTRWWVEKLVAVCASEGRTHGPAFATARGDLADPGDYNTVFRSYVKQVQEATDLVDESKEVDSTYSLNRTLRRTLQTRLTRAGMSPPCKSR